MDGMSILGNPTCQRPNDFTKVAEQLEEFRYKLHAYMNVLNTSYSHIFRRADEYPTHVIQYEDLHDVQQARSEDGAITHVVVSETKFVMMASALQNVLIRYVHEMRAQRYAEELQ